MSRRVTAAEFPEATAQGLVLADFYSDSCVPCKRIAPLLAELEEEGHFTLLKVNIAYEPELTEQYDILGAPTLVFFRDGAEFARLHGFQTKDAILDTIHTA